MTRTFFIKKLLTKEFKQCFFAFKTFSTIRQDSDTCLTSCSQLLRYLENPQKYCLLDATWDLETDCKRKHINCRIPQSKLFDLWECKDKSSPYPMMLPTPKQFEDYVTDLGVSNDHHVVIYDNQDDFVLFSSPRLWWMFRVFGHDNVSILNGGLKRWIREGHDTCSGDYNEKEIVPRPTGRFKADFRPNLVKSFEFIEENTSRDDPISLIEARIPAMMDMQEDETDISSKSVPGAILTPFTNLFDKENQTILTKEKINDYFSMMNVDMHKEVAATCEIGLTASILSYCIYYASGKDVPVYDGSMSEWSARRS